MTATDYFSSDYAEARVKFLDASSSAAARVDSFKNPEVGPQGEPLYTDVAVLGTGDARSALALGSATHGVEGFAGSAILTGLLRDGIASRLADVMRVVMIHATPPYGLAHLRRVNEDNVDLNRNFVDHHKPYPPNPGYESLAKAIAPKTYSAVSIAASFARLAGYAATHGRAALQAAISGGQYTHPDGLFFGGRFETWSNKTARTIAQRHLHGAGRVAFVDFHTGLGPHGYGEVISLDPPGSPALERAVEWWGDRTKAAKVGESVSVDIKGTIKLALSEMLPDAEVTAVSLEFGTVPLRRVLRAMQAENWLHHHGGKDHPRAETIKAEMPRVFYPDTDDWKTEVWSQGRQVVLQALAGMA